MATEEHLDEKLILMTIYLNNFLLILLFVCQTSCVNKKRQSMSCKDNFIGVEFLDKKGDLVKGGTIGIFFTGIEENELAIAFNKKRSYKLDPNGLTCLDRRQLMDKYHVSIDDTLEAFYIEGIGNFNPFKIPLSSTKITVQLKYYPKLPMSESPDTSR